MAYFDEITPVYDGTTYPVASGDLMWISDISVPFDRPCPVSIFTAYIKAQLAPTELSIAFTDGDTFRRVTVTDAAATTTSKIMLTIRRPDTEDSADAGWIYNSNIVKRATGSFDIVIAALDYGMAEADNGPNETIILNYQVF